MKFNELFTFDNLFNAHMQARKSKRHRKDVILFEMDLALNLWNLHDSICDETYRIGEYNRFTIYEPKKREIQALSYKDRVIQHCLCDNYLYPLLTSKMIYDNAACQKGKGTEFARERLTKFLRQHYKRYGKEGYVLKADIFHFFQSIDHDTLKRKICRVVEDEKIYNLLEMIIDSFCNEEKKGIPMGNQTSQLFALYYLDSLDRLIKEKLHIKFYTRYMDDCILIHHDKEYLKWCLRKMEELVEDELLLEFNNKTQLFPIKNGVDYLGFHFYLTDTGKVIRKLRTSSKKKFKKRMKAYQIKYSQGEMELDDIKKSLAGFNGHLSCGHTYRLKKSVYSKFVLKKGNIKEDFS